jgi:site-specific DNA-methyltransferase (adenine-specific)
MALGPGNHLLYGDNATVMRDMMGSQSVDLIYLDPPFQSDRNYNLIYSTMTGLPVPEQAEAFCDTWTLNASKADLLENMSHLLKNANVDSAYLNLWETWIRALEHTQPHLLAYLYYMVERLLWMKPILKNHGSIYLHCDPTASHYIKVMMDGIFGHQNFRNEIIWKRTSAHSDSKKWGGVHDTILFYSKSDKFRWNPVYLPHDEEYVKRAYRFTDARGVYRQHEIIRTASMGPRPNLAYEYKGYTPQWGWRTIKPKLEALDADNRIGWSKSGRPFLKRYLHEQKGNAITDIIMDIPPVGSMSKARLGYPTQKPKALLKRIIEASSNPGDTIFDPFCGCGTTIYATQELGQRTWIGCDIAVLAIKLIKGELLEEYRLAEGSDFTVTGIPVSVESARELFKKDPLQFQHWAVEHMKGFVNSKMSGDRGIDGRIYYQTDSGLRSLIISVKGGKLKATDIRDLNGTVSVTGDADMGGLISLEKPTPKMYAEAVAAGTYTFRDIKYPRCQLLTVEDILEGKRIFESPTRIGAKKQTGQGALPLAGAS